MPTLKELLEQLNGSMLPPSSEVAPAIPFQGLKQRLNPFQADQASLPTTPDQGVNSSVVQPSVMGNLQQGLQNQASQALNFSDNLSQGYNLASQAAAHPLDPVYGQQLADKNLNVAMGSLGEVKPKAPLYSKLAQTVEEKLPNAASPEQIMGTLNSAGVKPEEIKFSRLQEFLANKDKVSKAELQSHLEQNPLTINDTVLGGQDPYKATEQRRQELKRQGIDPEEVDSRVEQEYERGDFSPNDKTKFSQYKTPGGENYREVLYTLPNKVSSQELGKDFVDWAGKKYGDRFLDMSDEEVKALGDKYKAEVSSGTRNVIPDQYRSSHFDEPNILAHNRLTDRVDSEGNKMLFSDEIQSDWHQAGRKSGYKTDGPIDTSAWTVERNKGSVNVLDGQGRVVRTFNDTKDVPDSRYLTQASKEKNSIGGVPDAPLKKTWHEYALKRMLKEAAENGHDSIGFTTGEQQAARYDLSKQVDNLNMQRLVTNGKETGQVLISGSKDGNQVLHQIVPESDVPGIIGKDPYSKLKEQSDKGSNVSASIKGADLSVGGEGMKGFYDKMLPEYLNKFGKKFGVKVEDAEIPTGVNKTNTSQYNLEASEDYPGKYYVVDQDGEMITDHASKKEAQKELEELQTESTKVHSFKITPEMRAHILKTGFPLFGVAGLGLSQHDPDDKYSFLKDRLK